jgi:hypothetical protein
MTDDREKLSTVYENLDTAYVNLAALVRYLEGREFTGLLHVELDEYDGDIFLRAGLETRARERNHATGKASEGAAALQRLCVRAGEPGGLISVYEGETEEFERREQAAPSTAVGAEAASGEAGLSAEEAERRELLRLSGELLEAVERAVLVAGGDFETALHAARVSLTEDFPFLDPLAHRFEYQDGAVRLNANPTARLYVSGINEALRRVVERVATVEQRIGVRKDVVRELSTFLRRRQTALTRFKFTRQQFERIAGMKLM